MGNICTSKQIKDIYYEKDEESNGLCFINFWKNVEYENWD